MTATRLFRLPLVALVCGALALPAAAGAQTLVLVSGFFGAGRTELAGNKYWGGADDYQEKLKALGYPTVTAEVGPVSSNWDRAVELYAQLKGGTVDYGEAHAAREGHARFGRTYPALAPAWDADHRVDLFAHSQGGQTARVLVWLLEHGAPEEVAASGARASPLFQGGKPWVRSVTTLATPHRGTVLTRGIESLSFHAAEQVVGTLAALVATNAGATSFFDFKLDQWGLRLAEGESLGAYWDRVRASSLLAGHARDLASDDLSPEGADALSAWAKEADDVYYFSFGADTTERRGDATLPLGTTALFLQPSALWLAGASGAWAANDGVVNTASMTAPLGARMVPLDRAGPQKGAWNFGGVLQGWDHLDVTGHTRDLNPFDAKDAWPFYVEWAAFLQTLR